MTNHQNLWCFHQPSSTIHISFVTIINRQSRSNHQHVGLEKQAWELHMPSKAATWYCTYPKATTAQLPNITWHFLKHQATFPCTPSISADSSQTLQETDGVCSGGRRTLLRLLGLAEQHICLLPILVLHVGHDADASEALQPLGNGSSRNWVCPFQHHLRNHSSAATCLLMVVYAWTMQPAKGSNVTNIANANLQCVCPWSPEH